METRLDELIRVLEEERRIHEQLLDAARSMNGALRERKHSAIAGCCVRHDTLIFQIEQLEEKRLSLCDALGQSLAIVGGHFNLSDVIAALPADQRMPLVKLQRQLKSLIGELTKVNTSNHILLHDALLGIEKAVARALAARTPVTGYQNIMTKKSPVKPRPIFNRIA
jgi:uncharacterized coiled-coil protein SlyX